MTNFPKWKGVRDDIVAAPSAGGRCAAERRPLRLYRVRTRHNGCDLGLGEMRRLVQDRSSCRFASSTRS